MTFKQQVLGLGVEGAKCGIADDPERDGKARAMRRFLQSLRPWLEECYSIGPDMGTSFGEIESVARSLNTPSVKLAAGRAQGLNDEETIRRIDLLDDQVEPDGHVYALDIAEPMVEYVGEQSPPEHLEVMQCAEHTLPVGDGDVDVVILASVLHEALDRKAFAAETHRITTAGGRVASLEWKPIEQTKAPRSPAAFPPQEWREIFTETDFHVETIESWNASRYAALAMNVSDSQCSVISGRDTRKYRRRSPGRARCFRASIRPAV